MSQMHRISAVALLGCLSLGAHAKPPANPDEAAMALADDAPVAEQLAKVERALHSEDYSELSVADKSRVQAALDRIRTRMAGRERFDQLTPPQKVEVFNDQEVVNTLMTNAKEDSRMVCRSERPIGSNRPQRTCMTVAQRRQATEDARQMKRELRISEPKDAR